MACQKKFCYKCAWPTKSSATYLLIHGNSKSQERSKGVTKKIVFTQLCQLIVGTIMSWTKAMISCELGTFKELVVRKNTIPRLRIKV